METYRQYQKINLGSRTDLQRQVIKGKLRDKGDELRGFDTHLIGVPEEMIIKGMKGCDLKGNFLRTRGRNFFI